MNQKDRIYDYLKFRRKWFDITTIWSVSFILLLWILNYKTAFWILLVLEILSDFGFAETIRELEKMVGLR